MKLQNLLVIILILVIFVYGLFRADDLLSGPKIVVLSHVADEVVPQEIELYGTIENSNFFLINDRRVYPKNDGSFGQKLLLPEGSVVIKLYARNIHNKEEILLLPLNVE